MDGRADTETGYIMWSRTKNEICLLVLTLLIYGVVKEGHSSSVCQNTILANITAKNVK